MASKPVISGGKRLRDPSVQPLKIKFLINIPLKVDSEEQAKARCGYLLDKLPGGFREEDRIITKGKNGKNVLEDVAVIFGMNGKYTPGLDKVLKKLQDFEYDCKDTHIKHSVITYTWGKGGTIAQELPDPNPAEDLIPYQDIREYLKNNDATKELVEELRGKDPHCLLYFSFVDSDTVNFNSIYSEYIQTVREELRKDKVPPTVMSTGYEVNRNSEHHIATWLDRMTRVAVAEVHPLLVYYPEPNFCVLVRHGLNTIMESFIKPNRNKNQPRVMESAVLIRRVKERENFKAVFSDKEPIHIDTPGRFKLSGKGLVTGQSALEGMNLAICTYANGVLTNARVYNKEQAGPSDPVKQGKLPKGITGINRAFIIDLYNCKDDMQFEELVKKNPYDINGKVATILVEAIRAARKYRNVIYELDEMFAKLEISSSSSASSSSLLNCEK
ncbi:hypothetical protein KOW79_015111 [Hemibagrus wyckioides]|uniref:Uncharacterized protein n=1 Tax=Hemibagrus wyckioides TaxID=337641 RepID=A0A9D3NC63_9TELE|nr:uncharacterized protein LOC131368703 [Hemibagrus wyckioides]KAG7320696.1 hypothetical protein KOW79_015111 [Hemibagrus wyckioides]